MQVISTLDILTYFTYVNAGNFAIISINILPLFISAIQFFGDGNDMSLSLVTLQTAC